MEYHNCGDQWRVINTQIWLKKNRIANYVDFKETRRKCSVFVNKNVEPVVVTYSIKKWDNASKLETESFCSNSYSETCRETSNCNCVYDEDANCFNQIKDSLFGKFLDCLIVFNN